MRLFSNTAGKLDSQGVLGRLAHRSARVAIEALRDVLGDKKLETALIMGDAVRNSADFAAHARETQAELRRLGVENRDLKVKNGALDNENKVLESLVRTDKLTKVYNRSHFEERIIDRIKLVHRTKKPLVLLMLDIDKFKVFNDTYGHLVGDIVLEAFGEVVSNRTRASDEVFRYGGEEFTIIANSTIKTMEGARKFADSLRAEIEKRVLEVAQRKIDKRDLAEKIKGLITASIGVCFFKPPEAKVGKLLGRGTKLEEVRDQIVNNADKVLYEAKENGRNRVEISELKLEEMFYYLPGSYDALLEIERDL